MTTGATGQLGLALPVQGELSGTWGNTVNNAITEYTNIAIAATLTLTNDGAVTLANTTGTDLATNIVSSLTGAGTVTAQFAIVRVTGTLTTAKVVTAPSYSKTYTVVNAATGGIVTFKASGQTGVSIAVGESAFVYYNGTDYVKVSSTAAGAAGGSNTQVQFNSSGALAGSANLTFDGTTLTAAGFSGPLNGTVGATTANTGAFTTLSSTGQYTNTAAFISQGSGGIHFSGHTTQPYNITMNNTSGALVMGVEGSSGAQLAVGGSAYAAVFGNVANFPTQIFANNTVVGTFNSTGLGIGTSSPGAKLDVAGSTYIRGDSTDATFTSPGQLAIKRSSSDPVLSFHNNTGGQIGFIQMQANGTCIIGVGVAQPLAFNVNGSERARISSAGGFSVGTTADPGAGAIYATGNITAYYSSDIKFKENVRDIPDALATVNAIGGKLFDWKDDYIESKGGADGYFVQKADFGVVAQDVQKVFPIAVRTREDGSLAVDYEKLGALAFAALVELTKRVEALEAK